MTKTNTRNRLASTAATILLLTLAAGAPALAQKNTAIERYVITAMGKGTVGLAAGRASRLDLNINRWSTPEERQELLDMIASDDGDAIRQYVERLDSIGRLRIPGQSGEDMRYAWLVEEDGRHIVTVMSDRPLASRPGATTNPSQVDYLVMVMRFALDEKNQGTGTLVPAIQPAFNDKGQLTIRNSAADPISLTRVTRKKKKK
jgi:hypothetical protein